MLQRLITIGLILGSASLVRAQTEQDERARVHFESGRVYFEEGAYDRALQEFQQAYELSPRTAMLYNLGMTFERLNRLEEAADAFQQYLDEAGADMPRDPALLERRIANLRRRIREQAGREEAEEAEEAGAADGAEPGGDTGAAPLEGGTPPDAASPAPEASGGADGLVVGGAVALGASGLGLVLTGVFGGLAVAAESDVRSGCFANASCTPDDVADMDTFAAAADASWIAASVAGAAGVVLLVLGLTSGPDEEARAALRFTGNGLAGRF